MYTLYQKALKSLLPLLIITLLSCQSTREKRIERLEKMYVGKYVNVEGLWMYCVRILPDGQNFQLESSNGFFFTERVDKIAAVSNIYVAQ